MCFWTEKSDEGIDAGIRSFVLDDLLITKTQKVVVRILIQITQKCSKARIQLQSLNLALWRFRSFRICRVARIVRVERRKITMG